MPAPRLRRGQAPAGIHALPSRGQQESKKLQPQMNADERKCSVPLRRPWAKRPISRLNLPKLSKCVAREARRLMGPDLTLGVTCKGSRDLAMQAGEDGADYVAFGAFFPSGSKLVTNRVDPEILHWWSELMELPCCAIGGITPENCGPLVQAGADFLAVIGCVWGHPDGPAAGVRALNQAIAVAQGG
jgi:hypothetical protein